MLKQGFLLLTFSLIVSGCTSIHFTKEGQAVRTITPVVAQSCDHLGLVHSWKPVLAGGISAAQVDTRNQVGAVGGNAMVIISQQVDPPPYQHADIMAEAYICDFKKMQQSQLTNIGVGVTK